jgi:hypothetical protein
MAVLKGFWPKLLFIGKKSLIEKHEKKKDEISEE